MDEIQKKIILVIEDNPANMKLIADLLEVNGFCVLKAEDASSAFQLLKDCVPSLIVLDLRLPDMSGFEVFEKIKENPKWRDIKVFAVSASAMKEDMEAVRRKGFDAFLAKPYSPRELIQKIKSWVG